jgi:ABC-type multidrug transport system permease subunit
MIFIIIFGLAFNSTDTRSSYTIAIINEDGLYDSEFGTDYAAVSGIFVELFDPATGSENFTQSFIWKQNNSDGVRYNKTSALEDLENDRLDGIIIIPRNFSEIIVGGTWWYPLIESLPPLNQTILANTIGMNTSTLLTSNFPTNSSPLVDLHTIPDTIAQMVLQGVVEGILNDIILSYNDVKTLEVNTFQVNQVEFTFFDMLAPGFVIVGVLVAIMMVSMRFAKEKEQGLLQRLDSTPVPRWIHLVSGGFAQVIYSSIQIIIILVILQMFNVQTAPDASWALAFLTALVVVIPCIGIGLIVAAIVKSEDAAGSVAWLAIIPLQFLSNAFFELDPTGIVRFNPIYYGIRAIKRVMLFGVGLGEIWQELLLNFGAGIVLVLIGIVIFEKKTKI